MKAVYYSLALVAFITTARAEYLLDVFFSDNPTQVVSVAISDKGSGLRDFDQYLDLNPHPEVSPPPGTSFNVGIGIRIEITDCTISDGLARFVISTCKRTLIDSDGSKDKVPRYKVEEFGPMTLALPLNQWLLMNRISSTNMISLISKDRKALEGWTGFRIRGER